MPVASRSTCLGRVADREAGWVEADRAAQQTVSRGPEVTMATTRIANAHWEGSLGGYRHVSLDSSDPESST